MNAIRNRALSGEVLSAFDELSGTDVVWSRGDRVWRKRQSYGQSRSAAGLKTCSYPSAALPGVVLDLRQIPHDMVGHLLLRVGVLGRERVLWRGEQSSDLDVHSEKVPREAA